MKVRPVWVETGKTPRLSGLGAFISDDIRPGRIAMDVRRLLEQHAVPCLKLSIGKTEEQPAWMISLIEDINQKGPLRHRMGLPWYRSE